MSPIVVLAMPEAETLRDELSSLGVDTLVAGAPTEVADVCERSGEFVAAAVIAIGDASTLRAVVQLREAEATSAMPVITLLREHDRAQVLLAYGAGATDVLTGPLDRELLRVKLAAFSDLWEQRRAIVAESLGPTVPELRESLMDASAEVALTRATITDARARQTLNGLEQHLRRLSWVVGRVPTRHRE